MKKNRNIYILSLAVLLSVLCNSSISKAGGYYCSTCEKTLNRVGKHSNCTEDFRYLDKTRIYSYSNDRYCDMTRYYCYKCHSYMYYYYGYNFYDGGECCRKYSSEERDASSPNGPYLTKYADTMEEYFEKYGSPCPECAGTAEAINYKLNFNKNY